MLMSDVDKIATLRARGWTSSCLGAQDGPDCTTDCLVWTPPVDPRDEFMQIL